MTSYLKWEKKMFSENSNFNRKIIKINANKKLFAIFQWISCTKSRKVLDFQFFSLLLNSGFPDTKQTSIKIEN